MRNRFLRVIHLLAMPFVLAVGIASGEGEGWIPRRTDRANTAPTWGPYTAEGVGLTERNSERFGWVMGDFSLQPYAEARAVYEDNLTLSSADKQEEIYTVFSPGVTLVYGTPRGNNLYLDYSADFTSLQEFDNDSFDGQTLRVGGTYRNARSQLAVSHAYREVRDVDVETSARLMRESHVTSATYDNRLSTKTSAGLSVSHSLHTFSESEYSGYREYNVGGRMGWQAFPRAALTARAAHGWVDVDDQREGYGSAQYDEVAFGISGRPRPRLETGGDIGVQHRYFEDDGLEDITHWVGSVHVAGEPYGRTRFWVKGAASLRPAIQEDGYTVLDMRVEPGVSRCLFTERLVGGISVFRGRARYIGGSEPDSEDRVYNGRQDDYWGFGANLDWWIGRYWSVGIGYSYMENESDADDAVLAGQMGDSVSYEAGRWMIHAAFNR